MIRQTKTTTKELSAQYRSVLKRAFLAGVVALTTSVANAETDVSFSGKYTNTSGGTVNVTEAVAAEHYSYTKSDGTQRDVASQSTNPVLTDFTYTDKDGNAADLSEGTKSQSDFKGATAASGVVSTTQDIVSGTEVVRSNYSYVNGAGDTVELGEAAQNMVEQVALNATYAPEQTINVVNGVSDSFDGTLYTVTIEGDDTYHLSADGTLLYHSNSTQAVDPEQGSALATTFTAMKSAYTADAALIAAAETSTADNWTTEQTNFAAADTAFNTDTATVATLDTRWGTYETAAGLLADAELAQSVAQGAYDANTADRTAALMVYDAPINTTITNVANNAINASVAGGTIKTALDTKANTSDVATNTSNIAINAANISANTTAISDEATTRSNADINLQNNIDAEALARSNADDVLQSKIDNEVARATAQESALRGEIAAADALTLNRANAYTDNKVNALEKNVSGGVAAATALSAVNVSNVKKGEVSVGGGYGYYNNQSALAFGAAMGLSDKWSVNAGAGIASGDKTQVSFRAGTNYKFKMF